MFYLSIKLIYKAIVRFGLVGINFTFGKLISHSFFSVIKGFESYTMFLPLTQYWVDSSAKQIFTIQETAITIRLRCNALPFVRLHNQDVCSRFYDCFSCLLMAYCPLKYKKRNSLKCFIFIFNTTERNVGLRKK